MNITGIVVEYNPLHNGHIYHINKTKALTGSDYLVAVMSGNFVQRGEPALVNKWVRTEMALKSGVDLVLELPFIYSVSSAEGFAFGAVSTLNSLGLISSICFGSEAQDIGLLKQIARILAYEPEEYKTILRSCLDGGISYPLARQKALIEYCKMKKTELDSDIELPRILNSSNNILGIEYLKAIYGLSSKIIPLSIARIHNRYNQSDLTGAISSATAIRKNIESVDIIKALPDYVYNILQREKSQGRCPMTLSDYSDLILYKLRNSKPSDIENLLDVGEGLEHKILKGAECSSNIDELISYIKNKRYTATRIQRILLYALFDVTKDIKEEIKSPVRYIRVLGFNERGKMLLREAKKSSSVPIITNPSQKNSDLLEYDIKSTDIYVLGYKNPLFKTAKQDFKTSPIML